MAAKALTEGEVIWFSDIKGYGFIKLYDSKDAFIHQSVLITSGIPALIQGQRVRIATVKTPRGRKVVDIEECL